YSMISYAKNEMGTSRRCCFVTFFLPILVCNNEKGNGLFSLLGMISPSSTIPSGNKLARESYSGNFSVMSSSPRLHTYNCPCLFTSCPRIPSHFHSACHSFLSPNSSTG